MSSKDVGSKESRKYGNSDLPPLKFDGQVIFVDTIEKDTRYADLLIVEEYIGIDFEWNPDTRGQKNPFALTQISTHSTCYIWLMWKFPTFPSGLDKLLRNDKVLKIGCGMRTNDVPKMSLSGFLSQIQSNGLPNGFVDLQNLTFRGKRHGRLSLEKMVQQFLKKSLNTAPFQIQYVNWKKVEINETLRIYAATDAYVTWLLYGESDQGKARPSSHRSPVAFSSSNTGAFDEDVRNFDDFEPNESMTDGKDEEVEIVAQNSFSSSSQYMASQLPLLDSEEEERRISCQKTVYMVKFANGRMYLEGDSIGVKFHPGTRMRLYFDESASKQVNGWFQLAENDDSFIIIGRSDDMDWSQISSDRLYYVKQEYNPTPADRMRHALVTWTDDLNPVLQKVILGYPDPVHPFGNISKEDVYFDLDKQLIQQVPLNSSQLSAIEFALQHPFAMIIGPPGTGKTHTLSLMISNFLSCYRSFGKQMGDKRRLLICAPSNYAADHLASVFIEMASPTIDEFVIVKSVAQQIQMQSHNQKKRKDFSMGPLFPYMLHNRNIGTFPSVSDRIQAEKNIVKKTPIVCSTLSMAGGAVLNDVPFFTVIIDEASQCVESEALIGIAHSVQHLVLAGDDKQLGPVVMSAGAKFNSPKQRNEAGKGRHFRFNLERSLFERLNTVQSPNAKLLQVQYRMHPAISAWPMHRFYDDKVKDGISAHDRKFVPVPLPQLLGLKNSIDPNMLIHVSGAVSFTRFGSSQNKEEARLALQLYQMVKQANREYKVVILTPYLGQVAMIRDLSRQIRMQDTAELAYTISQFQGREADVIIFSLVRSVATGLSSPYGRSQGPRASTLGFSAEPKRINVGLTRAKFGQIVLGDVGLLKTNSDWDSLLQHLALGGCIFRPSFSEKSQPGTSSILGPLPKMISMGYDGVNAYSFRPDSTPSDLSTDMAFPSLPSSQATAASSGAINGTKAQNTQPSASPSASPSSAPTTNSTSANGNHHISSSKLPPDIIWLTLDGAPSAVVAEMLRRGLVAANLKPATITTFLLKQTWISVVSVVGKHFGVKHRQKRVAEQTAYTAVYRHLLALNMIKAPLQGPGHMPKQVPKPESSQNQSKVAAPKKAANPPAAAPKKTAAPAPAPKKAAASPTDAWNTLRLWLLANHHPVANISYTQNANGSLTACVRIIIGGVRHTFVGGGTNERRARNAASTQALPLLR